MAFTSESKYCGALHGDGEIGLRFLIFDETRYKCWMLGCLVELLLNMFSTLLSSADATVPEDREGDGLGPRRQKAAVKPGCKEYAKLH